MISIEELLEQCVYTTGESVTMILNTILVRTMTSPSSSLAGICENEQGTRVVNTLGFAVCHTAAVAQSRTSLLTRVIATLVLIVQSSSIWVKSSGTC